MTICIKCRGAAKCKVTWGLDSSRKTIHATPYNIAFFCTACAKDHWADIKGAVALNLMSYSIDYICNPSIEEARGSNGKVTIRKFLVNNQLSREQSDGPALECWDEYGQILERGYYYNGNLSRDALIGPALVTWYPNGQMKSREYYDPDGSLLRKDLWTSEGLSSER